MVHEIRVEGMLGGVPTKYEYFMYYFMPSSTSYSETKNIIYQRNNKETEKRRVESEFFKNFKNVGTEI